MAEDDEERRREVLGRTPEESKAYLEARHQIAKADAAGVRREMLAGASDIDLVDVLAHQLRDIAISENRERRASEATHLGLLVDELIARGFVVMPDRWQQVRE